jgi:single-strand DNA-binding protein
MSNTIIIHKAHLGKAPELRTTQTGKKILSLRIAEATRRDEDSQWYSVSVWGARGEALSNLLQQGSKIGVVGRLSMRTYEHNGEKRTSLEINANDVILLDGRPQQGQQQSQSNDSWGQQQSQQTQSNDSWSQSSWSQPQTQQNYSSPWAEQRNQNEAKQNGDGVPF